MLSGITGVAGGHLVVAEKCPVMCPLMPLFRKNGTKMLLFEHF